MRRLPTLLTGGVLTLLAVVAVLGWQATNSPPVAAPVSHVLPTTSAEPIQPVPRPMGLDPARVALGQALFFERLLSEDNSIACAECHVLTRGGADGRPASRGIRGQEGDTNAPTVFNAALNFVQFWDGRAISLEEQAAGPVHNPLEMGSSWPEVIGKLQKQPAYRSSFAALYPTGITAANIADAIAGFERSLLTPDGRFDAFLQGNKEILTADEKAGYRLFKELGCASCHQGANVGGNMYQKFGIFAEFHPQGRASRKSDLGRFNVTGREEDRAVFKVPGLRNVALTAPYFHDGSVSDLPTAVATMARVQLGRTITQEEVRLIVAFLGSLTGQYQGKPL